MLAHGNAPQRGEGTVPLLAANRGATTYCAGLRRPPDAFPCAAGLWLAAHVFVAHGLLSTRELPLSVSWLVRPRCRLTTQDAEHVDTLAA